MSRDRSLEDFLGQTGGSETDSTDTEASLDQRETSTPASPEANSTVNERPNSGSGGETSTPDPLETTYRWSPKALPCVTCGDPVKTHWRADGGPVCEDCKEW